MRFLGGAALVAALTAMLTGCGSQATESTATPSVTVAPTSLAPTPVDPTAEPTAAPTGTGTTAEPSATAAAEGGAPADQCADADLGVRVERAADGGAAGSVHYDVLLTNVGGETCALRGTPDVSVVGDGAPLGAPADRIRTGARTLTLQVGQTVAAPLQVVNIGTDGGPLDGCTVQQGDGYRVTVPHSTGAIDVADPDAVACAPGPSFMTVGPLARVAG